jgi:low affinity Fe/Cu permease
VSAVNPRFRNYGAQSITALTAATGTADNTVVDVGGTFAQATLNNNFKDVASKINEIIVVLRQAGLIS